MRIWRNLAFLALMMTLWWSASIPLRAADCTYPDGPSMGGMWCQEDPHNCSEYVFDCCGEDFEGNCSIGGCTLILPGEDCYCDLSITCEELEGG